MFVITARGDGGYDAGGRNEKMNHQDPYIVTTFGFMGITDITIDMHTQAARLNGETEQRIYALNAWQETPFFTPAERAVLALTESVTSIATNSVSDEIYNEVSHYFIQDEIANLLRAIVTINGWNRIVITLRMVPGTDRLQPLQT
jgi:Carboxymuconolactone decarboxylase family